MWNGMFSRKMEKVILNHKCRLSCHTDSDLVRWLFVINLSWFGSKRKCESSLNFGEFYEGLIQCNRCYHWPHNWQLSHCNIWFRCTFTIFQDVCWGVSEGVSEHRETMASLEREREKEREMQRPRIVSLTRRERTTSKDLSAEVRIGVQTTKVDLLNIL